MIGEENNNINDDEHYCSKAKSRWKNNANYRLIIWVWMMNETAIMFTPVEISHNGFYFQALIQAFSMIFVGIPLVYSEICLAQYTNCNVISMWNFFPLLKNVGYCTVFLILLKTIYMMVLTSWYLVYAFYAAMDPPPWFSCNDFDDPKCMVKSINVSVFQHCIEAQILFDDDCGMKTASNCFFEREIGNNNTLNAPHCYLYWKGIIASSIISLGLFILSIRKEKFTQVLVKVLAAYICFVILILFCVALSTNGTWYATKINVHLNSYSFNNCCDSIIRGFLSVGTGHGIIIFLSRHVSFRSPATMTSLTAPLFSLFVSVMLALIAFGGIKTMSYFHGEEENVIEVGESSFFQIFASMSEIMSYFDAMPIWGFAWFSSIFLCLFANLWILYLFLADLLFEINLAQKYKNSTFVLLISLICMTSWPFFCSDLSGVLSDTTEIIQILNSLLFSVSIYWIYGFRKHNIDIIFMIGIKASYFWKVTWVLNPILLSCIVYLRWIELDIRKYTDSYKIETFSLTCDLVLLYVIMSIYFSIVIIGILIQLTTYYRYGKIRDVFFPTDDWGPRDKILYKSRKLFVPEIMTREFLYRQVRIRGYYRQHKATDKRKTDKQSSESSTNMIEWSTLTSN